MTQVPQGKVGLGLDDRPAVAALKAFGETWSASFSALNQGLEVLNKGLSVVTGALGAVVDFGAKSVAAAEVQERAEIRLAAALRLRGEFTEAGLDGLKSYASALQGTTKHGDEALLSLQAQMLAMGLHASQLREATAATVGLAEITGSLESASKLVVRAINGDVAALKEHGIVARDSADAMAQLRGLMVLAEADAQTYEGRVQQLNNAWGDLLETFGFAVTKSRVINRILEEARVVVEKLNGALTEGGLGQWFDRALTSSLDFLDRGLGGLTDGLRVIAGILAEVESKSDTLFAVLGALEDLAKLSAPNLLLEPLRFAVDLISTPVAAEDTVFGKAASALEDARTSLRGFERDLEQAPLAAAALGLGGLDTRFGAGAYGRPGSGGIPRRRPAPRRTPGGGGSEERGQFVPSGFGSSTLGDLSASELAGFFGGAELNQGRTIAPSVQVGERGTLTPIDPERAQKIFGIEPSMLDRSLEQLRTYGERVTDWASTLTGTVQGAMQGLGNGVAEILTSAFEGANVAFDKMLGRIMVGLGQMLVSTGVASMALGLLSFIPGLQLVAGTPGQAIASGAIVTGVGAGLIGAGVALGGGSGGAVSLPAAPGGGFGGSRGSRAPTGFGGVGGPVAPAGGPGSTTIVYAQFGPGSALNPRKSARELRRAMGG